MGRPRWSILSNILSAVYKFYKLTRSTECGKRFKGYATSVWCGVSRLQIQTCTASHDACSACIPNRPITNDRCGVSNTPHVCMYVHTQILVL